MTDPEAESEQPGLWHCWTEPALALPRAGSATAGAAL